MARKNSVIAIEADTANSAIITITVADAGGKPITINANKLTDEVKHRAMMHGLIQKLSDAAALPKVDGLPADPSAKYAAIAATAERIREGEWNKRGDGEGSGVVGGVIFRALLAWKAGSDPEKLRAWYDGKTRSEQLALRNVPEIAAEIDKLKSAKTPAIDTGALVADLDNL